VGLTPRLISSQVH